MANVMAVSQWFRALYSTMVLSRGFLMLINILEILQAIVDNHIWCAPAQAPFPRTMGSLRGWHLCQISPDLEDSSLTSTYKLWVTFSKEMYNLIARYQNEEHTCYVACKHIYYHIQVLTCVVMNIHRTWIAWEKGRSRHSESLRSLKNMRKYPECPWRTFLL